MDNDVSAETQDLSGDGWDDLRVPITEDEPDRWAWLQEQRDEPALPDVSHCTVTAVLVTLDAEDWLPDTLAALSRLTVKPTRLIAVDNGSTDSTVELLERAHRHGVLDVVISGPEAGGFGAGVAAALAAENPAEESPDHQNPTSESPEDKSPAADEAALADSAALAEESNDESEPDAQQPDDKEPDVQRSDSQEPDDKEPDAQERDETISSGCSTTMRFLGPTRFIGCWPTWSPTRVLTSPAPSCSSPADVTVVVTSSASSGSASPVRGGASWGSTWRRSTRGSVTAPSRPSACRPAGCCCG